MKFVTLIFAAGLTFILDKPVFLHSLECGLVEIFHSRTSMAKKRKKIKSNRALNRRPDPIMAHYHLGIEMQARRRLDEAEASYRRVLALKPDFAAVHGDLGNVLKMQGKLEEAVVSYRRALSLQPDFAVVHYNLGNVLSDQGQLEEAVASYRRALAVMPDFAEAYSNLGVALNEQGKLDEAALCLRRALELKPNFARTYVNLGKNLNDQGYLDEAISCYQQAIALQPDLVDAYSNLGVTLMKQDKLDEAVANFRRALELRPDFAEAYSNLGMALNNQGKLEEAVGSFRRALELRPDFAKAYNNLGNALQDQGKPEEALASFRRALELQPDFAEAYNNMGNVLYREQCKLAEAVASYRRALELQPDFVNARSNLLFCLNYLPDQSISRYLDEAREFGRLATSNAQRPFTDWRCQADPQRLRIGMVSGDLRSHSVGYFLENVLAHIAGTSCELVAFPTHRRGDELTARLRSNFVDWKPLCGVGDEAAARLIHDHGIHVLLDLSGHSLHNRLPVFAWRPAPVQVTWLGYSASTGIAEMDYLLADPYVVPPGAEAHFTETVWRLPESYLCFSPPRVTVAVGPLPALSGGRVTFASFNNPTKMSDAVVALWAKVLHAVSNSQLLLKAKQFAEQSMCEAIRRRFSVFDIAPERLQFQGFVHAREEHLAGYSKVDIALDPFPYNGTTTSLEGLWMGVPFITRRGDRFISRVGESIAHNCGLADWIAMDDEDYVAKAVARAADLENLARLRARLRQQVSASPLFDAPRFARNFEAAMWGMWKARVDNE